jgi:hypothetical protein
MPDRYIISRREVIRIGGGAALLPLASALGLTAATQSARAALQVLDLKSLDHAQGELLLSVARTLFPHDFLSDEQYLKIVGALDTKASADKDIAALIRAALAAFPDGFTAMEEVRREEYLRSLEGSPFFRLVYQETMVGLYGDPNVASLLGYEGSSVEHGGYLDRGFDDIAWLPTSTPVRK